MQLPKINHPTITINVPPDNKPHMFRPMLVKDEKLLLMAKTSEDNSSILQAIKQVVNNCCLDPSFDINAIPLYALEYIFIKLRGFSIGDEVKVSYRDFEDDKIYDFNIDLKKVEIKYPEKMDGKIEITNKSGIILKHPRAEIYDDNTFLNDETDDSFYKLVTKCIDQVYDENTVYSGKDFVEKDLLDFVELLDIKSFEKIRNYLSNLPTLYYQLKYVNSKGSEHNIELKTLSDFFTLR